MFYPDSWCNKSALNKFLVHERLNIPRLNMVHIQFRPNMSKHVGEKCVKLYISSILNPGMGI